MSDTTVTARSTRRTESPVHRRADGARRRGKSTMKVAPVLWMLALAVFIVGVGVLPAAGDPVPSGATATIAVTVSHSDTLWSIAAVHRLPGVPTAEMVRRIKEANSLSGALVSAGDTLRIPVEALPSGTYAQVSDVSASR